MEETKKDPKKFWKRLNGVLKPQVSVETPTLIDESSGEKLTEQNSVNYFNKYFSEIGSDLSCIMTKEGGIPLRPVLTGYIDGGDPWPDIVVNKFYVEILIKEINVNKTSGIEGIRCDILKSAMLFLYKEMTHLYNVSFATGIFRHVGKLRGSRLFPRLVIYRK